LDFSKNPSAVNPKWNYVYSANNQPEPVDGFLSRILSPEDREPKQLLEPKSNWDKAAVGQMIYDNTSSVAQVVKQLISNLSQQALSSNEKEALAVLKKERL
jgi:penicillin amidase